MNKIIITQHRDQPCGSTLGAFEYHYSINYNGNYSYSMVTTKESIGYLIESLKKGNEVAFIEAWKAKV